MSAELSRLLFLARESLDMFAECTRDPEPHVLGRGED